MGHMNKPKRIKHLFLPTELFIPMEASSCEAVSNSATQEFPNILSTLKARKMLTTALQLYLS
jgi:hypothetical protein